MMFSPTSLDFALSMLQSGTEGKSKYGWMKGELLLENR